MKLSTITKKLENAGFSVETNGSFFEASNVSGEIIRFTSNDGETVRRNGFSYSGVNSCAPTYGMTLAGCMS